MPAIERSAGSRFHDAPGLEWIAEEPVASEEQHRDWARAGKSWVAVDETDRPFGWLVGERFGKAFHVWEADVRAGRALLAAAIAHARELGLSAVTLTTFRGLAWNEPFYARLGFRTLTDDELDSRLRRVLAAEIAQGLPADCRCAMRLALAGAGREALPGGEQPVK